MGLTWHPTIVHRAGDRPMRQEPPAKAPAHVIQFEPLTPENKLGQAERWLQNIEFNLTRKSATREENLRAALRDITPVAEKLDEAGCGAAAVHRDNLAATRIGAAGAYAICMKEHAVAAARYVNRGWSREAEFEIRHAIVDARHAVAALELVLYGRVG